MSNKDRYIHFKIETAENMDRDKVILLSHPDNKLMLALLLHKLSQALGNSEEDNDA